MENQLEWIATTYTYFVVSAFAIFIFDYMLTFFREVAFIWKRRLKLGGVLYLIARYAMGVSVTLYLWKKLRLYTNPEVDPFSLISPHSRVCQALSYLEGFMLLMSQAGMQSIFIMRAYAISSCNRYIVAGLACLSMGSVITASMEVLHIADIKHNFLILCTENLVTGVLTISFDVVLIIVTLYYTLEVKQHRIVGKFNKSSLITLLLQQGLLRFLYSLFVTLILLVPNISGFFNVLLFHGQTQVLTARSGSIQVSVTSRFFLDLQWSAHAAVADTLPVLSTLRFRVSAAAQRAHDSIREEFGGYSFTTRRSEGFEEDYNYETESDSLTTEHHTLLIDPDDLN
ncbi:hypothetical protein K439DRAFT_1612091 [Ramaria rubella]|nr:hypothetical protein K439DRAFT_1612091 [Ramaria rubella]